MCNLKENKNIAGQNFREEYTVIFCDNCIVVRTDFSLQCKFENIFMVLDIVIWQKE